MKKKYRNLIFGVLIGGGIIAYLLNRVDDVVSKFLWNYKRFRIKSVSLKQVVIQVEFTVNNQNAATISLNELDAWLMYGAVKAAKLSLPTSQVFAGNSTGIMVIEAVVNLLDLGIDAVAFVRDVQRKGGNPYKEIRIEGFTYVAYEDKTFRVPFSEPLRLAD